MSRFPIRQHDEFASLAMPRAGEFVVLADREAGHGVTPLLTLSR